MTSASLSTPIRIEFQCSRGFGCLIISKCQKAMFSSILYRKYSKIQFFKHENQLRPMSVLISVRRLTEPINQKPDRTDVQNQNGQFQFIIGEAAIVESG